MINECLLLVDLNKLFAIRPLELWDILMDILLTKQAS